MFRTIIVDDEPYIRKSIKTSIEDINPLFHVIAEAGNGKQAYEMIKELKPDVVFLDIRMPIMDGISLLEKLYTDNLNPIRVILSGYSEFEYAKKALKYQVFDYVVKPIHLDQLEKLLNEIAERIISKRTNAELQYFNYIYKGVTPSLPLSEITLTMNHYSGFHCFYIVAGSYMYTKNNQFNPVGDFWDIKSLSNMISTVCSDDQKFFTISGENQNEVLVIIGDTSNNNSSKASQDELANKIYDLCCTLPVPITLIYKPFCTCLDELKNIVIDMKFETIEKTRFGQSTLILSDCEPQKTSLSPLISDNELNNLKKLATEQRYHDFKHSLKLILESYKIKRITQNQLKVDLISIFEVLNDGHLSYEVYDFIDDAITNLYTYENLTELLLQYIDDHSRDYYQSLSQNIAEDVRKYIDDNYATQLTLKDTASHFHISPTYLSTMFKKTFSVSPNEYLMNKRISKAKDLLMAFPPIPIKQIALSVGYTDSYYFSRIFKMITKQTPSEFRCNSETP